MTILPPYLLSWLLTLSRWKWLASFHSSGVPFFVFLIESGFWDFDETGEMSLGFQIVLVSTVNGSPWDAKTECRIRIQGPRPILGLGRTQGCVSRVIRAHLCLSPAQPWTMQDCKPTIFSLWTLNLILVSESWVRPGLHILRVGRGSIFARPVDSPAHGHNVQGLKIEIVDRYTSQCVREFGRYTWFDLTNHSKRGIGSCDLNFEKEMEGPIKADKAEPLSSVS